MKRNNLGQLEMNFVIYALDRDRLWELRNFCYEMGDTLSCKINLFLTGSLQTAYDIFLQIKDGVDVFHSEEILPQDYVEVLQRRIREFSPTCRCITRERESFVYVSYFENGLKLIEHWYDKESSFENGIYKVLQKMIQEEKRKNV